MIQRNSQVTDEYDRPVPGATVYVYNGDGTDATLTLDGTTPITEPITTDEFGSYSYYAADAVYREDIWFGGKLRSRSDVIVGEPPEFAGPPGSHAGTRSALATLIGTEGLPVGLTEPGFEGAFVFDTSDLSAEVTADPNHVNYVPPASDGTGASGAWVRKGSLDLGPRRFAYGPRAATRTLRQAVALCDTIHTQIVGYAAGTTGGYGKTKYLVDNESTDPNKVGTWNWALASARANGGGIIHFDTRGHLNIKLEDDTHRLDFDNLTVIAPGRNVTFWAVSLAGSLIISGKNIVIAYIFVRTMPGTLATYNADGTKDEKKLVTIDPHLCDQIAMIGCEYRHSSDGACDITTSLLVAASPQCRVTIQDFIFWDTDQPMMVGSGDPLCTATDPPLLMLTLHNGVFAYCGERQPKVLGRCTVDMSNVYTLTLPFQRDQLAPTNEFSDCYGAAALFGGTLQARGCLWEAAVGSGYPGLEVSSTANGASVLVDGAASATDCAAVNMTIVPGNVSRIPALTYTLAHDPVPAAGNSREDWIATRWATCGARPDSAPEGLFAWTADESAYPNGETVLIDRIVGGRWLRIDAQPEFVKDGATESSSNDPLGLARGTTLTIASGAITLLGDRAFAITGEGGVADTLSTINLTTNPDYTAITEGLILIRTSSSGAPITLDSAGNIGVTSPITLSSSSQWLWLLWEASTSKWNVIAGAYPGYGTSQIGYATGAGGAVTQATDKTTGVTLNKLSGKITMNAASLAASTSVSFTLTNSQIAATDVVIVNISSGATANSYIASVGAVAAGSCRIALRNVSAGALAEAVALSFAVIKGASA